MSGAVGMGVVGAGSIGIRAALDHLSLDDAQDRVRLAAVCDPAPGRAAAAAEKYGVPAAYESYDELLADPNVDAVTLCSPIGIHFEQGLAALRAGKHVHFNKTMTITTAGADTLIEEAALRGLRMVASPGQMLRPLNRRVRRLVQEAPWGAWRGPRQERPSGSTTKTRECDKGTARSRTSALSGTGGSRAAGRCTT